MPKFEPVGLKEMRDLWRRYRGNKDIERLLLEIQHSRRVIHDIDVYFVSIQRAWRGENLGTLVALEKTRLLLMEQNLRQGVLQGLMPAPGRTEAKKDDEDPDAQELVEA